MKFLEDVAALIFMIISVIMLASMGGWFVSSAHATQPTPYETQVQVNSSLQSNASAASLSTSNADSTSVASGVGIGQGGMGIGGSGGIGGVGGGATNGNQNISIDQDQIRQSPAVFMNAPAPTAPCQATAGGFVSFIAGGGFAASYTLEECEIREAARIAHGVGQYVMAKEIICMGKFAKLTSRCMIAKDPLLLSK